MAKRYEGQKRAGAAVAVIMALLIFLVAGGVLGWFVHARYGNQTGGEETVTAESDGLVMTANGDSTVISFEILSAEASVSATSTSYETATVIATVEPDNNATDTGVVWTVAWADASSSFASGKSVSDYVTVTPAGDDYASSKTVTVNCLQAFGETIVLTATLERYPSFTASCTLEYARKLASAEFSIGDYISKTLTTASMGSTAYFGGVNLNLNTTGSTNGGLVNVNYTFADIYTLEDQYTVTVEAMTYNLVCGLEDENNYYYPLSSDGYHVYYTDLPVSVWGKSIYFDRGFFDLFGLKLSVSQGGYLSLSSLDSNYLTDIINARSESLPWLAYFVIDITGKYTSYEWIGYVSYAGLEVGSLTLDYDSIIF